MVGRKVHAIRFGDCKFTFKQTHLERDVGPKVHFSKIKSFMTSANNQIEFKNCSFLPSNQVSRIKEFIRNNCSNTQMTFVNCTFKQRGRTLFEKIVDICKPISFDLHLNGIAEITNYKFRVKDIARAQPKILSNVAKL